jgi:hypothetical protein
MNTRRDCLVAGAALAFGTGAVSASAARRYTVADLRRLQPILARHEGVWEGVYRRYDALGKPIGEHRSRVVIRYRPDPKGGNDLYEQSNYYHYPDGRLEEIHTLGSFDGERLRFYSERVDGWAKDDTTDPDRRACILFMRFKKNVGWYTAGVQVYELINISDDGRHRSRMTQHLQGGRAITRTLIDETFRTRDWAGGSADWKAEKFAD